MVASEGEMFCKISCIKKSNIVGKMYIGFYVLLCACAHDCTIYK